MTPSPLVKRPTRRRALGGLLGVALSAGLILGPVASAFANPDTTTTSASTTATMKVKPGATFRARLKLWQDQRQAIANSFRSAVAAARKAFDIAKSQSITSADRYAARTQFDVAIAQAAETRSAQLIALGAPPSSDGNANTSNPSHSRSARH